MAITGIPIDENQCIGDSLSIINSAFATLDTRTSSAGSGTVTNVTGLSPLGVTNNATTPVVSLTGVVPSNLGGAGTVTGILKANGSGVVSAAVAGTDYISTVSPAASKAWGCFTTRNGGTMGNVLIYKSFNITSIDLISSANATYKVNFTTPMEDRAYSMTLGCAEQQGTLDTGGIICCTDSNGNVDYPTTQPSPDFTTAVTSGKTTAAVKIGFGTPNFALNPTEAYFQVFG